jgi:inorganic pyrophosphatase
MKVSVPVSDPNNSIIFVRYEPHLLKEIEHFFQVYKDLENKTVDVGGWDVNEVRNHKNCTERFNQIENKLLDYSVLSNTFRFYNKSNIL